MSAVAVVGPRAWGQQRSRVKWEVPVSAERRLYLGAPSSVLVSSQPEVAEVIEELLAACRDVLARCPGIERVKIYYKSLGGDALPLPCPPEVKLAGGQQIAPPEPVARLCAIAEALLPQYDLTLRPPRKQSAWRAPALAWDRRSLSADMPPDPMRPSWQLARSPRGNLPGPKSEHIEPALLLLRTRDSRDGWLSLEFDHDEPLKIFFHHFIAVGVAGFGTVAFYGEHGGPCLAAVRIRSTEKRRLDPLCDARDARGRLARVPGAKPSVTLNPIPAGSAGARRDGNDAVVFAASVARARADGAFAAEAASRALVSAPLYAAGVALDSPSLIAAALFSALV
jgi:hypothetical protein